MQHINPNTFSETLARITKSPTLSAGNLEEAALMIAKEGCRALHAQRIGVWFLSEDMTTLQSLVCYDVNTGQSSVQNAADISNCAEYKEILKKERLFVVNDVRQPNPLFPALGEFDPNLCAFMDAPIHEGGKLAGVVGVEQHHCEAFPQGREWTMEEQHFASSLADFMAIAMESAKRHNQMHRTETLLHALPGMVYQCTAEPSDYNYTFVSNGCLALTGYTAEELTNGTVSFRHMVLPNDMQSIEEMETKTIAVRLPFEGTYRIMTKDGTIKWIWDCCHVIEFNSDGTPYLLEGFKTDISERQRREIAEKERKRIQVMLDSTPLICNLWSQDYRVIDCNERACSLFEMDKEEYMDKFFELAPEFQPDGQRTSEKGRNLLDTAFREGKCVFEWMNQKLDGTLIPTEVTLIRVSYGDDDVVVGYGRDLRQYNQMVEGIAYRDHLLKAVNRVAALLLTSDIDADIQAPIMASLEMIGRSVTGDRVSIWRTEIIEGNLYHTCEYVWNIEGEKQNAPIYQGLKISSDKDRPEWKSKFLRGECINGPLSEMPPGDQEFLGAFGMKSVVILPLFIKTHFWGLITIGDRLRERHYTDEEINILWSASLMMASTIHRHLLDEKIAESQERIKIMFDATPLGCSLWDEELNQSDANMEMVKLFGLKDKQEFFDRFFDLSPEHQPNGVRSSEYAIENLKRAFRDGYHRFEHLHQKLDGTPIPVEVTLVRIQADRGYIVAGYIRDLREHNKMLADMRETQERVKIMFDTTPLGCNLWNEEFHQIDANLETVKLFGVKDKQEYLDRFFDLSPEFQPDGTRSTDFAMENLKRAFRDGYHRFEHVHQKLDGTLIPCEVTLVRVPQENGYNVASYQRDLREHNTMLAKIREADELTQIMFDATPLCCQLIDSNARTIDCNKESVRLFGVNNKQEFLELDNARKFWPEFQPNGQRSHEMAALSISNAFEEGSCVFEWTFQMTDGTPVPVEVTMRRVKYGDTYVLAAYTRDLREHNRMMSEIAHRNNLMETVNRISAILLEPDINEFKNCLFTAMGMMAEAIDVDRVCIWKNYTKDQRRYCTLAYEWLNDALLKSGSPQPGDLSYDDILPGMEQMLSQGECINKMIHEMPPETQTHMAYRGIHSVFLVPVFIQNLFWGFFAFDDCHKTEWFTQDEEKVLRFVSRMIANALNRKEITFDILKTTAQLEEAIKAAGEANRSKSNFLAMVSHEMRTPMNAIIGMTELVLREEMPNTTREHVATIKQAGVNLLSIINDILDIAKTESGSLKIIPTKYLLASLINDVISIIRMRTVDSQVRFTVYLDCNLPHALIGDEARIRQVLINLLGNAVKYTDKGYVSLAIHGQWTDENTTNLIMAVKDTGRGIKKESLGELFESFAQLDLEFNKNTEGAGLGLAISQNLVKAMGGEITVKSEYGKGSTFTVILPQKVDCHKKLAVVESPDQKSAIVYERRGAYADSLLYAITNLGIQCVVVSNDAEFCETMKKGSFPFIFVSQALLKKNNEAIIQFNGEAQIVLLEEFGETQPFGNWSVLSMPVHAISVANVFNGVSEKFSYNTSEELTARFIAPDAQVLIVDDINTNLKVARGLLLPYEMEIDLCCSGMEAIQAVQSKKYDLVFMDHRMPEMDGVEATERIRALDDRNPYYKDLPIVALTANAVSGMREKFLQSGFNDFLSKPIDTVKLNTILEQWIPKDKQRVSAAESVIIKNKILNAKKISQAAFGIEGLDVKRGIVQSGGTVELFLNTLETFSEDAHERIGRIRECCEIGNIPLYTTYVHALKGATANIGAVHLSEKAKTLEMAGKRNDLAFIQSNTAHFLTMLERLVGTIGDVLSLQRKGTDGQATIDVELLKSELAKLKSALTNMDGGAINRIVDTLQKMVLSDDDGTAIRNISKNIMMVEYDAAVEQIDALLQREG